MEHFKVLWRNAPGHFWALLSVSEDKNHPPSAALQSTGAPAYFAYASALECST